MASPATAATTLVTLTHSNALLPLPSWKELSSCESVRAVIALLVSRRLLHPLDRPCPTCRDVKLHTYDDKRYLDGIRLRCNRCKSDWCLRHGSVFARRKQTLADLTRELSLIEQHVHINAASRLHDVSYNSSSQLYRDVREMIHLYMQHNPIKFAHDDIVEIDECYLKAFNQEKEQEKQIWIIGMIARARPDNPRTRVALEMAWGHKKEEMRRVIAHHIPHTSTVTISDRHQSFNFLEEDRKHYWAIKKHTSKALWVETEEVVLYDHFGEGYGETRFNLHSNTIEGFWSHFRKELRGYQKNTLHLYLSEIMFRRMGYPLSYMLTI
jgi:transposase-like protein